MIFSSQGHTEQEIRKSRSFRYELDGNWMVRYLRCNNEWGPKYWVFSFLAGFLWKLNEKTRERRKAKKRLIWPEKGVIMVLISDGNSGIGAQVCRKICNLVCFRHLSWARAVAELKPFEEKSCSSSHLQNMFLATIYYEYHGRNKQISSWTVNKHTAERNLRKYK